jgi:hypothetical protein
MQKSNHLTKIIPKTIKIMTDESILKPLDLPDEPVGVIADRTSFLTVGAQKPWDIEETKFGKIATVHIVDEMKKSYLDYAMSVIVSRALPDARDGLKPVHRRILFGMKELALLPPPNTKNVPALWEMLGKYHPHGDTAVYDALARLAQISPCATCSLMAKATLVVDGDRPPPCAIPRPDLPRSREILADLDKETVNWIDNFDGTFQEPTVMPARLPNLLLMGSDGIAVGMAAKSPAQHRRSHRCDNHSDQQRFLSLTPGVKGDVGIENLPINNSPANLVRSVRR